MARTRSDFLTRGTFADGEGDTEEDDCGGNFEFLLSSEQPPHAEAVPAARLGQACYSDSEMVIFISVVWEMEQESEWSCGSLSLLILATLIPPLLLFPLPRML